MSTDFAKMTEAEFKRFVANKIRKRQRREISAEGVRDAIRVLPINGNDDVLIVKTIMKLPGRVRRKTLGVTFVVFNGSMEGFTEKFYFPPRAEVEEQDWIFLRLKTKSSEQSKMSTIAHEIAHVVLKHNEIILREEGKRKRRKSNLGPWRMEKEADDLIERWGFERSYKDYGSMAE